MQKVVVISLSILEFLIYTTFMVFVGNFVIDSAILKLILHFTSLLIISILIYYFLHFILSKLNWKAKKYIYQICFYNIVLGIIFPIVLIILIPNEGFTTFAFLLIVCTCIYGLFVNLCLSILNYFLTNRRKNRDNHLGTD